MKNKIPNFVLILFLISFLFELRAQSNPDLTNIKNELHESLLNDILNVWYPKVIDTVYGGYLSDFNSKWEESGNHNKMLVSQARHIWSLSKMYEFLGKDEYSMNAKKGYEFLIRKMLDNKNGAFHHLRDRKGDKIVGYPNGKQSYSLAFSIYALAAYYKISNDEEALEYAQKTFLWLDKYAHDNENKGYFDLLTEDGSLREYETIKNGDNYNINPLWKDQNSSIHILEAFTELYSVWPDHILKGRLGEMLKVVRDVIVKDEKYLTLYLTSDWNPISFRDSALHILNANIYLDHVSFGHDIETAFLMLEASHALGIKDDKKTLSVAKKMVDHSLKFGWDNDKGGFYYMGYYFKDETDPKITDSSKVWWVQAEGLNSLLLMSELFPDENKYLNAFNLLWDYIKKYMIDHDNGGWFEQGLDHNPESINNPKSHVWKTTYHNVRALMHCIKMLEN